MQSARKTILALRLQQLNPKQSAPTPSLVQLPLPALLLRRKKVEWSLRGDVFTHNTRG
jgi:hypothetical protein